MDYMGVRLRPSDCNVYFWLKFALKNKSSIFFKLGPRLFLVYASRFLLKPDFRK